MRLQQLVEYDNKPIQLPDNVAQAFAELGAEQRGHPEHAMLKASRLLGGGVLSFVLEHVGDLTHRMSHHAPYGSFYPGIVKEKVKKTLGTLTSGYGFEKEHEENMQANNSYRKEKDPNFDEDKLRADIEAALIKYAEEHSKLVVYNDAQWQARQAAIWLGRGKYKAAIMALNRIEDMLVTDENFTKEAAQYKLDDQDNLISV